MIGIKDTLRPYSLRVNTKGRLDGKGSVTLPDGKARFSIKLGIPGALVSTLHSFVLSDSTKIFHENYQPRNVREDVITVTCWCVGACGHLIGWHVLEISCILLQPKTRK